MKLLIVSAYFEAQRGGVELVAGTMARWFAQFGHEVTWAATDASPPPAGEDFCTASVLPAWDPFLRLLGVPMPLPRPTAMRRIVKDVGECDALVLHDCLYLPNILAFVIARLRRRPVVLIQHIGHVAYKSSLLRWLMKAGNFLFTRNMLAAADQAVFISHSVAAQFATVAYKATPLVVFNGVDCELFRPPQDKREAALLKAAFGVEPDRRLILFVGRFVEKKGLTIVERVARAFPHHTFVLAGRGPIDPAGWGLANVVVKRDLDREKISELYRAADLLLLPSQGEGYPLVVQEALACGLPVLCSAEIVAADPAIANLVTSVAFEGTENPASARAFQEKVPEALRDEPTLPQARRRHAVENYRWDATTERLLSIIRRVKARAVERRGSLRPARFVAVSLACAGLNLGLLALGDAAGLHYWTSGLGVFGIVLLVGYFAHTFFTRGSAPDLLAFARYAGTMSMNLPLHALILWLVCGNLGASSFAGGAVSLVILTAWNFAGVKWAIKGTRS